MGQYYSAGHLAEQDLVWSPAHVTRLMSWPGRATLVAISASEVVVGVASLYEGSARTVFVRPDLQGRGIGRQLMRRMEELAAARQIATLSVQSTVNAEPFYQALGYRLMGERLIGQERYVLFEKRI